MPQKEKALVTRLSWTLLSSFVRQAMYCQRFSVSSSLISHDKVAIEVHFPIVGMPLISGKVEPVGIKYSECAIHGNRKP